MMLITRLPAPPQAEIITLDDIKAYCRLDGDLDAVQEDVLLNLRDAAIETGEHETGVIWRAAEYEIKIAAPCYLCGGALRIPISPVSALIDPPEAAYAAFLPSDLEGRRPWASIMPISGEEWPEEATLKVVAGWTAETLPKALRLWALNRIASANEIHTDVQTSLRETVIKMPREHSERLLDRYRVYGGPRHA